MRVAIRFRAVSASLLLSAALALPAAGQDQGPAPAWAMAAHAAADTAPPPPEDEIRPALALELPPSTLADGLGPEGGGPEAQDTYDTAAGLPSVPDPEEDRLAAIAGSGAAYGPGETLTDVPIPFPSAPGPLLRGVITPAGPAPELLPAETATVAHRPAKSPPPARRTPLGIRLTRSELEINLADPDFLEIRWLARDGRILGHSSGRFPSGRSAVGLARPKAAGPVVLEVRGSGVTRRFPLPG